MLINEGRFDFYRSEHDSIMFLSSANEQIPNLIVVADNIKTATEFDVVLVRPNSYKKEAKRMEQFDALTGSTFDWFEYGSPEEKVNYVKNQLASTDPSIFQYKRIKSKEALYSLLISRLRMPTQSFDALFGEFNMPSIKYKNASIQFVGSFSKKKKDSMIKMLDVVDSILKKKKFGFLIEDGNIVFMPDSTSKLMGTYSFTKKVLYVNTTARYKTDQLRTIIHELGHKLTDIYTDVKFRNELDKKYNELIKENDSYQIIVPTQKTLAKLFKKGTVVEYTGKDKGYKQHAPLTIIGNNGDVLKFTTISGKIGELKAYNFMQDWAFENGEEFERRLNGDSWFPTEYARKDSDEFFCELFSFYMIDKITNKEVVNWLENLIKKYHK